MIFTRRICRDTDTEDFELQMHKRGERAEKQFCKAFGQRHGEELAYILADKFLSGHDECTQDILEGILEDIGVDTIDCFALISDLNGYLDAIEEEMENSVTHEEFYE